MPPIPKRSDQLHNKRGGRLDGLTQLEITNPYTEQPEANPEWHPIAMQWYESLPKSGQSHYYQASDWATAFMCADLISREFHRADDPETKKGVSAMMVHEIFAQAGNLLTTEGERRRLRLELIRAEKSEDTSGVVTAMEQYKQMAGGSK